MKQLPRKISLTLCLLTLSLVLGCKTAPTQTTTLDTPAERSPANTNLPHWTLRGLDDDQNLNGVPEVNCLQKYMDKLVTKKPEDPEPFLAKRVLEVSEAMRIDPYIFAGLIQQESGDFVADTGRNGVGLTQMTNIAIRDACVALEGTTCQKAQANPKYLETWESLFEAGIKSVHYTNDFRSYYPWRSQCIFYKHSCESNCGIDNACMIKIRQHLFQSFKTNLVMGAFTLRNKLGEAKAKRPSLKGSALYLEALELYNGHPSHQVKYAKAIMNRHAPAIIKACPPVHPTTN